MEVFKWTEKEFSNSPGYMIRVSPEEAIDIIQSLTTQMANKDCNSGRKEFFTKKNEYFSMAVEQPVLVPPNEMELDYIYHRIE